MTHEEDLDEKKIRQEKFKRKRERSRQASVNDSPRIRKTDPYKRRQMNYLDHLDEDWDDDFSNN